MTSRTMGVAAVLSALALVVAACGDDGGKRSGGGETSGGDRIPVVASTNAWGSVVAAVGGEQVAVKSLVDDPVADPHSYESTAEDGLDVAEAELVVVNGGGYDDFAIKLLDQAAGVPAINAFALAGHAEEDGEEDGAEDGEEDGAEDGEHAEEGHGHEHGAVNEHVWYDPHTVSAVADAVAAALSKVEPGSASEFEANAKEFKAGLAEIEQELEGLGEAKVLATEPVAHYLIEAAGLDDVTPEDFSEAVEGETDVPVAAQNEVTSLVEGKQVAVVINNPQTETDVTEELVATAEKAGVPVVDMTETLPEGTSGYLEWIRGEVADLKAALQK